MKTKYIVWICGEEGWYLEVFDSIHDADEFYEDERFDTPDIIIEPPNLRLM